MPPEIQNAVNLLTLESLNVTLDRFRMIERISFLSSSSSHIFRLI